MLNKSKTDAMTELPSDLHWMSAWQIREAIVTRRLSASEVACHFIERIDTLDQRLHAFFTVSGEVALDQARDIDRRIDRGEPVGPLAGVPVSIKDQFWTKGIRTTGGSRVYADHVPDEDSLHVARVKAADGLIIGKTSTPEFGTFWRTVGRVAPECVNPWDAKRTSGGSSGALRPASPQGSDRSRSAAIRRLDPVALGHVRRARRVAEQWRVPRHGSLGSHAVLFGRGADQPRCARCCDIRCNCWRGRRRQIPCAGPTRRRTISRGLDLGVAGLRLGWWEDREHLRQVDAGRRHCRRSRNAALGFEIARRQPFDDPVTLDTAGIDEAWKVLDFVDRYAALGEKLYTDAALPSQAVSTMPAFASPEAKKRDRRSIFARCAPPRRIHPLLRKRRSSNCDLLLSPTLGYHRAGDQIGRCRPSASRRWSPIRWPSISPAIPPRQFPAAFVAGMPIGLQVIAPPNQEALVLRVCRAFELAWPWAGRKPRA